MNRLYYSDILEVICSKSLQLSISNCLGQVEFFRGATPHETFTYAIVPL